MHNYKSRSWILEVSFLLPVFRCTGQIDGRSAFVLGTGNRKWSRSIVMLVVLTSAFLANISSVMAQSSGNCLDTPPYDDNWGWNPQVGASCKLDESSNSTDAASSGTTAACTDSPPFNDDWGWNQQTGTSCRLSADNTDNSANITNDGSNCTDTPPFDDVWGWNSIDGVSCRLNAGDGNQAGTNNGAVSGCIDTPPYDDDWGWNSLNSTSCRLSVEPPVTDTGSGDNSGSDAAGCVDSPPFDDDWGWNSLTSQSCRLSGSPGEPDSASNSGYPLAITSPGPRVSQDWTGALGKTWDGLKSRNIDAYGISLVNRPRSEAPGDAVSEGVGYAMILALYSNDQSYFNKVWDAGEQYLWNGRFYDWRADQWGNVIGTGAATDAEEDIAMMLIFADHLVKKGVWSDGHRSPKGASYAVRAQDLLDFIWTDLVDGGRYLKPGNGWGGRQLLNPGYFAPAWYRLYKQFDSNPSHNWDALINQSYDTIEASNGYSRGLVPDWSDAQGNVLVDGPGYNAYDNGHSMFKDGIRVFWRISTDALWFNDARARQYLKNAMRFIKQAAAENGSDSNPNSPAHMANFYQLNGIQVPLQDVWIEFNGGNTQRYRNEHSHLTIAMWAAAAMGAGDNTAAEAFSRELAVFYENGNYWGRSTDPTGRNEDIAHNELYFDQFLAWFGAATLNGNFCNVLDCIK